MPAQIIIAYANDSTDSLIHTKREFDTIYEFLNRMDKELVNVVGKPDTNIEQLFTEFQNRRNDLRIFHFSGHSGAFDLLLRDQQIDGRAIAQLVSNSPIELVFLNGCANKDLVQWFHNAGVKRVIATSKKVFDEFAADFSIKFYSSLSQFETIGEAFNYAKSYMVAIKQENPESPSRHISTNNLENITDFPFGLYYKPITNPNNKQVEDISRHIELDEWKLANDDQEPSTYKPCLSLLKNIGEKGEALAEFIAKQDANAEKEISQMGFLYSSFKEFIDMGEDIDNSEALSKNVIDILPRPLSETMRQMIACAKEIRRGKIYQYRDLLKYMLRFYDVLVKFSCFTILSNFFEVIEKKRIKSEKVKIKKEAKEMILRLLKLDAKSANEFNYRELTGLIREAIVEFEIPFVTEEAENNAIKKHNLDLTSQIFTIKKHQFDEGKIKEGFLKHCKAVEDELCNLVDEVYFILRYDLLVVRNVEAIRVRFSPDKTFQHKILLLRNRKLDKPEQDSINECTVNYSVILVKGLNTILDYLSLSPFIIDKCVLTNDNTSQLFYYYGFQGDALIYEDVLDARDKINIERGITTENDWSTGRKIIKQKDTFSYIEKLKESDSALDKDKVFLKLLSIQEQFKYFRKTIEALGELS